MNTYKPGFLFLLRRHRLYCRNRAIKQHVDFRTYQANYALHDYYDWQVWNAFIRTIPFNDSGLPYILN